MIDPKTLDLRELPSLPLESRKLLPKTAGIYFAIDSLGVVQYVGRSVNLFKRWQQYHHRYDDLASLNDVRIAYLFVDVPELLPEIESALIEWFQPRLNNVSIYRANRQVEKKEVGVPKGTVNNPLGNNQYANERAAKPIAVRLLKEDDEAIRAKAKKEEKTLTQIFDEAIALYFKSKATVSPTSDQG